MSKPPHLLFLVTEDWYFVSHRLALARAALAAGFRVSVATRVSRHADIIRDAGIELIAVPFRRSGLNPLREIVFLFRVVALYRRLRPDIVHQVAMKPVVLGSLAARLAGIDRIVNALGGLGYVFSSRSALAMALRKPLAWLLRTSLDGARGTLILQNQDDRTLLLQTGGIAPERVRLIRGVGVDVAAFAESAEPAGPCLIVLPARFLRDKGVWEFVEAARQLRAQGTDARFALVGAPDPDNPASIAQSQVDAWVREGAVECWGWREDMAAVFAQANIVCLPSYREGLPKALVEAAAAGRAIVTTDAPGCREVVGEGVNGLLVPVRDAHALARALKRLIDDAPLRRQMAARGRERAQAEFRSDQSIAATLGIYRELLAR